MSNFIRQELLFSDVSASLAGSKVTPKGSLGLWKLHCLGVVFRAAEEGLGKKGAVEKRAPPARTHRVTAQSLLAQGREKSKLVGQISKSSWGQIKHENT